MAKKKTSRNNSQIKAAKSKAVEPTATGGGMYAARETIESIVIAFVLAFLFRTFEAEAFVIPTGSMSPSLQGQHKDVCCSECGYRFRTTASSEGEDRARALAEGNIRKAMATEVMLGVCPMCRQTMAMRPDLPEEAPLDIETEDVEAQTTYPGDRILVNKYAYNGRDPERWDVVVFKYPGNGEMNYIKRLVGLPNETIRIYQGDIFIRDDAEGGEFQIQRKPADKVAAMLQPVHDTDYECSSLYQAGWPLRWSSEKTNGWQVDAAAGDQTVQQQFHFDTANAADDSTTSWLRYHHYVPHSEDWVVARQFAKSGEYPGSDKQQWIDEIRPQLIRDFNPYNANRLRGGGGGEPQLRGIIDRGWQIPEDKFGMHWVGDLAVSCEVNIKQPTGELHLDLVEAGEHFRCQINLKTGEALIGPEASVSAAVKAQTPIRSSGSYEILFANIDDQLLLWVDGELVKLTETSDGLVYDADVVFDKREDAIPTSSDTDAGDLAPVGIGAQRTQLTINRLQVLRDIYYVATNSKYDISDYSSALTSAGGNARLFQNSLREIFSEPSAWKLFSHRKSVDFSTKDAQLFVMGDNSPASQDCRLWEDAGQNGSKPGGPYLDRRLLIGKAVCVFWPHSWGGIPGASKLPGFPNFGDMRLVR